MTQKLGRLQRAWVELLETTDYPQTRCFLMKINPETKEPTGFCCLGLLECVIMGTKPSIDIVRLNDAINENRSVIVELGSNQSVLTNETRDQLQFYGIHGDSKDKTVSLAGLNDINWSFKRIAKTIRKNPNRFFKGPA